MNSQSTIRRFEIHDYDAYRELIEVVKNAAEHRHKASAVWLIGHSGAREEFACEFRNRFRDQELAKQLSEQLKAHADHERNGRRVPFCLASERDALTLIEEVNRSERGNNDFPIRTIVIIHPEEEELDFVPMVLRRCPKLVVYEIHEIDSEEKLGIVPVETALGFAVQLKSQPLTQIQSEAIEWLYKGYLPRGMVATLFAPKGRGKTKICDYFTTVLTTGRTWADGTVNELGPQRVLRFNLEDPVEQVLKPALHAAGADLNLVEYVEPVASVAGEGEEGTTTLNLTEQSHVLALKQKIQETSAALVIIEPLNNYKGRAKSISEDDMRPLYMSLSTVARETGAGVLVINHANKKKDVDVLEKSLGAGSGPAVARVNWFLEKNPDNPEERILTDAGSNLPTGPSLVFSIISADAFDLDGATHRDVGYAKFLRTDSITGDELLERVQFTKKGESQRIADFLREYLKDKGEVDLKDVKMAAHNENPEWSWDLIKLTFSRQKIGLSRTEGGGKKKRTFWSLTSGHAPQDLPF